MDLPGRLRTVAAAHGLDGIGVCSAEPFDAVRRDLEAAVENGRNGTLRFTFGDPATATDVRATHPWARALVVAARSYLPEAGSPGPGEPGTGRVARFATEDHYRPLRRALAEVRRLLEGAGKRAAVLVDDNRLVDRAAAVRAGVGWWGKNTMVLAPGSGPWLLLGSVVTDAELEPSEPMSRDCGSCSACLPACPTGALVAPGVLDARLCLAHWAQAPGVIPAAMREPMGDRVYGCDDCLDACPPGGRLLQLATADRGRVDLVELLSASDRTLRDRFAHFYIPRNQARHLRRNAIVAAGNSGDPAMAPVMAGYLGHPDWLLRAHAAWAVARLGGPGSGAVLATALRREAHPVVRAELEAARGR